MSTPKNNEKFSYFGIVINAKKESANPYQELAHLQANLIKHKDFFVATIIHEKDLENNLPKTIHLHAYIEFSNLKHTKKQMLELISACLKIEQNQISILPTNNDFLLVQYLTHKNDQEKYQYNFEDILTNNNELLSVKYNKTYITREEQNANLENDIRTCRTMLEFISKQGVANAQKFRNIFNDVKAEQHLNINKMLDLDNKLELFTEWLLEHKRVLEETIEEPNRNTDIRYQEFIRIFGDFKTRFREYFNFKN